MVVSLDQLLAKPDLSDTDLLKLKVTDLRKICREKSLDMTGTKSDLVVRILGSLTTDSSMKETEGLESPSSLPTSTEVASSSTQITTSEPLCDPISETEQPAAKRAKFSKIEAPPSKDLLKQQKIEERMKRFGPVNEETKKSARTARFQGNGTSISSSNNTVDNPDVLKKRAERFNLNTASSDAPKVSDEAVKKRIARFGEVKAPASVPASAAAEKRKLRFGSGSTTQTEAMKLKRAERFGLK